MDQPNTQPATTDKNPAQGNIQPSTKAETTNAPAPEPLLAPAVTEPTVIASLSTNHQQAFLYWVDYFELSNPRQVKRLNNSYNLLHSYYDYDSAPVTHGLKEPHKTSFVFPMMIALFIMEYLNTLDDPLLRIRIKAELRKPSPKAEPAEPREEQAGAKIDSTLISADIILVVHHLTETLKTDFIKVVEPFVLPAIECH
jgi:hypothetical protein